MKIFSGICKCFFFYLTEFITICLSSFQGCIRVWDFNKLPEKYKKPNAFKTTFKETRLPNYEPVKILVRVYCVRGCNLKPADPNGKADPYLCLILGKNKVNDKKNLVKRQLNPEFGR